MTTGGVRGTAGLAVACLLIGGCVTAPEASTSTPATSAPTTQGVPTTATPLGGFATITVLIAGDPWQVAVADTPALRQQGLMGVTDLGDLDGMFFAFDVDTEEAFWMKDTLLPLDIAFFSASGSLVDLLTMTPCTADPCPTYPPSGPYRYAVEAPAGAFAAIDRPSLAITEG